MSDDLLVFRLLADSNGNYSILRQEAATALTEARAEIEALKVEKNGAVERGLMMLDAKNHWADRALAAESELATLRDILVLCGELGGMQPGETMADYLRRLIDEVAGVETERELAKAAAITAYLAQREKEGWVVVPLNPNYDMGEAGMGKFASFHDEHPAACVDEIYRAMIANRPLAAAQNGGK